MVRWKKTNRSDTKAHIERAIENERKEYETAVASSIMSKCRSHQKLDPLFLFRVNELMHVCMNALVYILWVPVHLCVAVCCSCTSTGLCISKSNKKIVFKMRAKLTNTLAYLFCRSKQKRNTTTKSLLLRCQTKTYSLIFFSSSWMFLVY